MERIRSKISLAWIPVLAVGLLRSPGQAQPDKTRAIDGVYRGTIGTRQIVLQIGAPNSTHERFRDNGPNAEVMGWYFYRQHGVGILLEGSFLEDGSLRLHEYSSQFREHKRNGAEWRVWFQGNTGTGFFCRCDVTRQARAANPDLKISLARVSEPGDPAPTLDKLYDDLLLDYPLRSSAEIMVNAKAGYVVQTDERFKVGMPHLTHFPDAKVMELVNLDLARKLKQARLAAAACLEGSSQKDGMWDESVRVAIFSDIVLSIVRQTGYNCVGTVHPDAVTESFVYDMRTGAVLDLKDFFEVQTTSAVLEDGAVPQGATHDLLIEHYRRHYVKPRDCDSSGDFTVDNFDSSTTLKIYFDHKGLVISPELSHAIAGCGPEKTIPYQELRPFLRKEWQSRAPLNVWSRQ
jgi:hypothetical protein